MHSNHLIQWSHFYGWTVWTCSPERSWSALLPFIIMTIYPLAEGPQLLSFTIRSGTLCTLVSELVSLCICVCDHFIFLWHSVLIMYILVWTQIWSSEEHLLSKPAFFFISMATHCFGKQHLLHELQQADRCRLAVFSFSSQRPYLESIYYPSKDLYIHRVSQGGVPNSCGSTSVAIRRRGLWRKAALSMSYCWLWL